VPASGYIVALKDRDGDRRRRMLTERFGSNPRKAGQGGTGIALWNGALYAEEGDSILRCPLTPGTARCRASAGEAVASGPVIEGRSADAPLRHCHGQRLAPRRFGLGFRHLREAPIASPAPRGADPCIEQQTRGGIWAYRADKTRTGVPPADRWATGIRNTGGIAFDSAGRVFATQHGRDQLSQNWPALYSGEQGTELPSEILFSPFKGADFGWPTCYYDGQRHVLAPEYGGDGGKTQGRCAGKTPIVAAYPAHSGADDVAIYTAKRFPPPMPKARSLPSMARGTAPPHRRTATSSPSSRSRTARRQGRWIRFADGLPRIPRTRPRRAPPGRPQPSGPDGSRSISPMTCAARSGA
jgi:hypothetical protein